MSADAVVCTGCGYDFRTDRWTRVEPEPDRLTYRQQIKRGGWELVRRRELPLVMLGVGLIAAALVIVFSPYHEMLAKGSLIGRCTIEWGALALVSLAMGWFAPGTFGEWVHRWWQLLAIALVVAVGEQVLEQVDWFAGGIAAAAVKPLVYYALLELIYDPDRLMGLFAAIMTYAISGLTYYGLMAAF